MLETDISCSLLLQMLHDLGVAVVPYLFFSQVLPHWHLNTPDNCIDSVSVELKSALAEPDLLILQLVPSAEEQLSPFEVFHLCYRNLAAN